LGILFLLGAFMVLKEVNFPFFINTRTLAATVADDNYNRQQDINTMTKTIDHFSINDLFWVQIKEHLISFGFKGLPTDTHFTIGFDDRSPDINLHITKNTAAPSNKPKITIVTIDKTLLEQDINSLALKLLNKVLQPFDINEHKNKYDYNLGFVSFENIQNSSSASITEQGLIDSFKDISQIKSKTRLKIKGDIESRLENFAKSEVIQSTILDNIIELTDEFITLADGGMIISEENTVQVIRFNGKWFTLRTDLKPMDFVTILVNSDLAKLLYYKTKRALIIVKNSNTFDDTRQLNKPIRLVRQPPKEKIEA
jgi:hypothetical protein